jgi:hypothetical protein
MTLFCLPVEYSVAEVIKSDVGLAVGLLKTAMTKDEFVYKYQAALWY